MALVDTFFHGREELLYAISNHAVILRPSHLNVKGA
jgi:hypothetical protein